MGWSSGGDIMDAVIKAIKPNIADPELREKIYKPIYEALVDGDWDTVDESMGQDSAFDKVAEADGWSENGWNGDND